MLLPTAACTAPGGRVERRLSGLKPMAEAFSPAVRYLPAPATLPGALPTTHKYSFRVVRHGRAPGTKIGP
eukprot:7268072-Pyramimonas_sp.AAC.1